ALDVPAGATVPPGARPAWLVDGARLPEQKIERVLLAWVIRVGAPLGGEPDHLLATEPAQAAVIGDTTHPKINVVVAPVGMALRLERAHQPDDLRDRLARLREDVGGQHVERRHVAFVNGGFL